MAQTEQSVDRQNTEASSQATAADQTASQAEQDLVLAYQGRLPLSKDAYDMCKVISQLLHRASEKARDGHVTAAEHDVFMVRH